MIELIKFEDFDENKKNILINYTLHISSNFCKHSSKIYANFFNLYKNDYNIILFGSIKTKKYFIKYAKLLGTFSSVIYFSTDYNVDNWVDYLKKLDIEIPIKIDKFVEIGGVLNTVFYKGQENQFDKLLTTNIKSFTKFMSAKKMLLLFYYICFIIKKYNLPTYHLIYDPSCCDYSKINYFKAPKYKRFFLYDSKIFNFKKIDNFIYYYKNYKNDKNLFLSFKKVFDLILGYSVTTKKRNYFIKYDELINKVSNKKIFIKDKYRKINTFINKEDYLNYLKKSYFTLILPAYNKDSFSYIRFIESIANNCIPLIHEDCEISEAFKDINITYLIVNTDNILNKINELKLNFNFVINKLKDDFINKELQLKLWEN